MKQILITIFLIAGAALYGQGLRSAYENATVGTDSVIGKTASTITIPEVLNQEYDYSYQIIPTQVGVGDSVHSAVALWVSNSSAGTSWTEVTSARDTIASTNGLLIEGTDAKNMRHRLILTGVSLDTSTVIVYYDWKLDRLFK
ncbi:unnamed protein product [marine sediment metagenome]|uniref:Uncharacterized protein n=1 Tax=marine sediment metagenome TaxID=412755 RepID=X0UH00_9ZZZZ